jgi:hypothetical protein
MDRTLRSKTAATIGALCVAFFVCVLALHARAQEGAELVGAWYDELAVSETRDGRPVNFRRWLRINRPDGTQIITFRFYLDNRLESEQVWNGVWGYRNNVYWTECKSQSVNGRTKPCSDRRAYDVHSVDSRAMAYANRQTGERFSMTRVSSDFQLP